MCVKEYSSIRDFQKLPLNGLNIADTIVVKHYPINQSINLNPTKRLSAFNFYTPHLNELRKLSKFNCKKNMDENFHRQICFTCRNSKISFVQIIALEPL